MPSHRADKVKTITHDGKTMLQKQMNKTKKYRNPVYVPITLGKERYIVYQQDVRQSTDYRLFRYIKLTPDGEKLPMHVLGHNYGMREAIVNKACEAVNANGTDSVSNALAEFIALSKRDWFNPDSNLCDAVLKAFQLQLDVEKKALKAASAETALKKLNKAPAAKTNGKATAKTHSMTDWNDVPPERPAGKRQAASQLSLKPRLVGGNDKSLSMRSYSSPKSSVYGKTVTGLNSKNKRQLPKKKNGKAGSRQKSNRTIDPNLINGRKKYYQ